MTDKHVKVAVIGAAGYTAGELIRLLYNHPNVAIVALISTSQSGKLVNEIHQDLVNLQNLEFIPKYKGGADVIFLCMGHGKSRAWVENHSGDEKIIDLSHDFRLAESAGDFIYGLPEFQRKKIKKARHIANPGCFATAIQLALLPLAKSQKINGPVHINGITGSTGAGQSLSDTSHFSWRNNNVSLYKEFEHQHLHEIGETLNAFQQNVPDLLFIPVRGNFTRGIFVSAYTKFKGTLCDAEELYKSYYEETPFTHVSNETLHLKQVVNTNNCFIHVSVKKGYILVTSVIDNLLKGASGQAVQNLNLMFGLDECAGLQLKASYF